MEKRFYPDLQETVFWDKLPSGLPVVVIPRPGFSRKIAYFVTDYGSIHTEFSLDGKTFSAPEGVAHYLEHKLFDMPDRDISGEFAALGANPNAFTSYDMTAYYFSCTENFPACLSLLLEFVSTGWFTPESVEKEQGIIGQEIAMNEDSPDTRVFELLMDAMYQSHPIRHPILGTRESIARITPEVLDRCHRAFYHPGNMLLCVIGDVDPEEVCRIANDALPPCDAVAVQRQRCWQEPMTVSSPLVTARMEVSMPMFQLGFKCEYPGTGEDAIRQEIIGDLAAEALFGEASELYLSLYEQGLIDASFGGGFETVEGMAMLTVSGDSHDAQRILELILTQAEKIISQGIPQEELLRLKRSALGRRLRSLDSFDATCFRVCAYYFSGFDYFHFPALYRNVELSDIQAFLQRVVTRERAGLCIIYPIEQEETNHVQPQ